MAPTATDVARARAARQARSDQDVRPGRVLTFIVLTVSVAWWWLGPAWAVVAAVFVGPPWLVVAIGWLRGSKDRIDESQREAIRRVRVWQDPVWRLVGLVTLLVGVGYAVVFCLWPSAIGHSSPLITVGMAAVAAIVRPFAVRAVAKTQPDDAC